MIAIDPPALSPAERQAVLMLGEGHTAKSIAATLGTSVHAVNERLREARRKTGLGSSREVARWLLAHENRDKQIGVVEAIGEAAASLAPDTATGGRRRKELIAMTLLAAAALALATLLPTQSHDNTNDPYSSLAHPATDTATLYRQVRAERVDVAWAPDAEQQLERLYAPLAGLGRVRVTCAATLCEVAGEVSLDDGAMAAEALQGAALARQVRAVGFADAPAFAIGSDTHDMPGHFLAYWRRASR